MAGVKIVLLSASAVARLSGRLSDPAFPKTQISSTQALAKSFEANSIGFDAVRSAALRARLRGQRRRKRRLERCRT